MTYTLSDSDKAENKFVLLKAKNEIRDKVLAKESQDILWTYIASNVISILEVEIICVKMRDGYLEYKVYI